MFQHVLLLLLLLFCLCQVGSVQLFINSRRGSSGSINSFNGVCTVKYRSASHTIVYRQKKSRRLCEVLFQESKRPVLITAVRSDSAWFYGPFSWYLVDFCTAETSISQSDLTVIKSTLTFLGSRSLGKFLFPAAKKKKNFNLSCWQGPKPK